MQEKSVFLLADSQMLKVVNQIGDDQWTLVVPAGPGSHKEATIREKINYMAYDEAWIPDTLSGKTIQEVGTAYDGDLLGNNAKFNYAKYYDLATASVKSLDEFDKQVHLTYGDYKTSEYLFHIGLYRCFSAYDLGKILGQDTAMPTELVDGMWELVEPNLEMLRSMGVFPTPVEIPEIATKQDKLLGMCGRDPK